MTDADRATILTALQLAIAQQSTLLDYYQPLVVPDAAERRRWRANITKFRALYVRLKRQEGAGQKTARGAGSKPARGGAAPPAAG